MSRRIVTGLLRGEMSFTGLVTSDCMEMQAVQKFFGSVNGVLAAMNAGVDLVLLSHTTLLSGEAAKAAAEALQSGKLDRKGDGRKCGPHFGRQGQAGRRACRRV